MHSNDCNGTYYECRENSVDGDGRVGSRRGRSGLGSKGRARGGSITSAAFRARARARGSRRWGVDDSGRRRRIDGSGRWGVRNGRRGRVDYRRRGVDDRRRRGIIDRRRWGVDNRGRWGIIDRRRWGVNLRRWGFCSRSL
jgi:hypothetical protein